MRWADELMDGSTRFFLDDAVNEAALQKVIGTAHILVSIGDIGPLLAPKKSCDLLRVGHHGKLAVDKP